MRGHAQTLSTPTALLCPVWESLKLIKALIVAQKASEWERTLSDVGHMAAMVQWCTPILAWNMVQVRIVALERAPTPSCIYASEVKPACW